MTQVIAELGINHNGEFLKLLDMIEAADNAGADYVKIQKRDPQSCYSKEELDAPCESPWGKTVRDKVFGRELTYDEITVMADQCSRAEMGWGFSAFDFVSLREMHERFSAEVSFYKVPSAMAVHDEYLHKIAELCPEGVPLLVSTGLMGHINRIKAACNLINGYGKEFVVLVTTSVYPCTNARCNIRRIERLQDMTDAFSNCSGVGYSGHETGILPSVLAASLGATWIERHFTCDRAWYGADQAASLEPDGMRRLVRDVSAVSQIMGTGGFGLLGDEKNPVERLKRWV